MAADVNEIISKEAIDSIRNADKLITQVDEDVKKFIPNIKDLGASFRTMGASLANIEGGYKKVKEGADKLTQIQKDEAKAIKATESAAAALNKQRQAALSQLAKQEAKERELAATLKMEVKTLQDAQKQNSALTQARKTLDLTTEKGRATLTQYNSQLDKNTKFIRENSDAAGKQRMNIGNYKSAVSGLTKVIAGIGAAWASLTFFKDAFREYEQQEQANRKLLFALKDNKVAFKELTAQANEFQSKTGIADDAIQGIQVLAAESGKSVKQIKDITEASITLSKLKGIDLQSAYFVLNTSLSGTAKGLKAVDAEFAKLTKTQLESGAAIDLINTKFKGFAENATTDTERLSANWNEFKELIGKSVSGVIVPALSTLNKALTVLNNESFSFSEKMAIMRTGNYNLALSVLERKKAEEDAKKATDQSAIANASVTKEIIKNAQATAKAKTNSKEYIEEIRKAVLANGKYKEVSTENVKTIEKTAEELDKLAREYARIDQMNVSAPIFDEIDARNRNADLLKIENEARKVASKLIADEEAALWSLSDAQASAGVGNKMSGNIQGALASQPSLTVGQQFGAMTPEERKNFAVEQAQVVADTTFDIMAAEANAEFDLKMSLLEKEKQARLDVAKSDGERLKIEQQFNKKAAKLKQDEFKRQRNADVIQSIANTILAVTKLGILTPAGIAAGIAGAALTIKLAKQPIPQFDSGSSSTPSQFIAGERRPEFMITPSGGVQLVTKPTLFQNMAGATVIGGEETAEIMRATNAGQKAESIAPYISRMERNIVTAIKDKRELHISAKGDRITEREGNYNKTYFNRKISWGVRKNS